MENSLETTTPMLQTNPKAVEWWMDRHEGKKAELKAMGQVDMVMIGDSITQGWEADIHERYQCEMGKPVLG